MWLKGTFHLEICNFLVLLALHNYVSCHLSHCGIPRQIRFSLHLSHYWEIQRRISPIALQQMMSLLNWGRSASFRRSLLNRFCAKRIPPPTPALLWNWDFPLTSALPSKRRSRGLSAFCSRYSKWTENDAAAERLPSPWESERSAAKMGVSAGGWATALERFKYWLAAVIFKKLLKTFSF